MLKMSPTTARFRMKLASATKCQQAGEIERALALGVKFGAGQQEQRCQNQDRQLHGSIQKAPIAREKRTTTAHGASAPSVDAIRIAQETRFCEAVVKLLCQRGEPRLR